MNLRPDLRHIALQPDEDFNSQSTCRKCGAGMVVLPDDRRNGYCFDCMDILDAFDKFEKSEGRLFSPSFKMALD